MIKRGQKILHYKILDKLGSGGMGVVYKAQDLKLERFVALKFLSPQFSGNEEDKQRFIYEAKSISALDHNNICTIYEIEETSDGQMFIAMAYYEGGSVKEKIKRGPIVIEEAVDLAMQIAQGLAKAHEQGVIHRDIKPGNVVLSKDGVAKIVDFGLAKLAGALRITKTGTILGTPAYMSPEQARVIDVDHRTDLWSLGVVLYEMLTGQLPFRGENEVGILYAVIHDEPVPIQEYSPEVPPALLYMLKHALEKMPDRRYPSANDFLSDLQRLKKDLANVSQRPGDEQQAERGLPLNREMVATMTMQGEGQRALILSEEALPAMQSATMSFSAKLQFLTKLALVPEDYPKTAPGSNPYLNRLMIQNPNDFYGRNTELTRIYERIKAVRPQSMSIVGVRRIGKSSLLKAIHQPENRRKYLPNPEEYVFVFVDAQAKRNVERAELFQYIYQELQREYRGHLKVNVNPDYDGLREIVQAFQGAGLKLIFLWDEFESITKNQKFGPEFYAYFRSLANNFNVAYITTSSDQLQSLCHAKEISDSPFFNIFTNLRLSVFKPNEANALIAEPSAQAGKPLAPYRDFILEIAGYFPFFIQMACSALFSSPPAGKSDYKKIKEIFLEEAKPHFQEFWERFDESEKAVVVALAKGKTLPREHAFALKDLAQAGFVSDGKVFSSPFAEFVCEAVRTQKPWWQLW